MFAGILIEFRGNISDGINSVMVGIVKHVNPLQNPSRIDCMVICVIPLDSVFMGSIAAIGEEWAITRMSNRFTKDSEIKLIVAHVSNRARHLMRLPFRSRTYTNALVSNCGVDVHELVTRLVHPSPVDLASHSV